MAFLLLGSLLYFFISSYRKFLNLILFIGVPQGEDENFQGGEANIFQLLKG